MKNRRFIMQYSRSIIATTLLASTMLLGACATDQPYYNNSNNQPYYSSGNDYNRYDNNHRYDNRYASRVQYGRILDVRYVQLQTNNATSGVGVGVGAVAGGLLGNQIGGGSGRTAATVIGAIGGGVLGNEIERRNYSNRGSADGLQISVRLDNRENVTIVQPYRGENFQPGQNVRVVNENGNLRVVY